jgi:RNA polymerase sigma-70 factor (ECF subfamily)
MDAAAASTRARPEKARTTLRLPALLALTDQAAMDRVQRSGDAGAFALLLRRWRPRIHRLCLRMTGDEHLAEDLAQETFARLFARRRHYRGEAPLGTYLWRTALNLCTDERRRLAREPAWRADPAEPATGGLGSLVGRTSSPYEAAARSEREAIVRKALADLPEHYRSVVVLRHYEGLKFREIADVLAIPQGTVKSRMAEALTRLEHSLRDAVGPDASG